MNQDDFKTLLNEALEPLRNDIKELKDVQENRLLPSVIGLEITVKGYADAYKTNKANIERLDSRVTGLEDRAGITPPSEFTIQR